MRYALRAGGCGANADGKNCMDGHVGSVLRSSRFSGESMMTSHTHTKASVGVLGHMEDTKGQAVTKAVVRDCTKAW